MTTSKAYLEKSKAEKRSWAGRIATRVDFVLVATVILSLFSLWPLLYRQGLSDGHDTLHHVYRSAEMLRAWSQGILFPRWAESFYYGYGSPVFSYYAPLTYYFTAGLMYLGLDAINSYRVLIALCSLLSGAGMYLFVKARVNPLGGLIAALCYIYSPYLLYTEPYARGDFPELLAFAIFPWVMWGFNRLLLPVGTRHAVSSALSAKSVFAALSVALLILSHNLMGLVLFALLMGWLVWNSFIGTDKVGALHVTPLQKRLSLFLPALLGFGLAAFFWLPVVLEQNTVRLFNVLEVFQRNQADYFNFYIQSLRLFGLSPRADAGASNGMLLNLSLGVVQWVLALVGIFVGTRHALSLHRNLIVFFSLAAAAMIFLMLPFSGFLWRNIPQSAFLLFPWRFLGPVAFCLAVLAGMNAVWISQQPTRTANIITALLIATIITLAAPAIYATDWLDQEVDTSLSTYHQQEASGDMLPGTTSYNEFLPRRVNVLPLPTQRLLDDYAAGDLVDKMHYEVLTGDADIEILEHNAQSDLWRIQSVEPFELEVLTFYWPGWQAEIDDQPAEISASSPHGFITVDMPAGDHILHLFIASTPVQHIGILVSLIAAAGLIGLIVVLRRTTSATNIPFSSQENSKSIAYYPGLITGTVLSLLLLLFLMREGVAWVNSPSGEALVAQHPVRYELGEDMQLLGYDLSSSAISPGGWLELTLYWYASRQPDYNYATFVHITTDPNQPPAAQADKASPAGRVTREWTANAYVRDSYAIRLPDSLPPGEYQIRVGLWTCDVDPCARLNVTDADGQQSGDTIRLASLTIH